MATDVSPELLKQVAQAINGIRYGSVQITIHDSKIVQIEKTEKIRLVPPPPDDGRLSDNSAGSPVLRQPSRITGHD